MPSNIRPLQISRLATLIISFLGTIANFVVTTQLLTLWHSYKWDADNSEWEWLGGDKWRVLGFKVVWILLSTYFAAAAAISFVGLTGVAKNKASLVRFYRDYYIADFFFCTSFALAVVYAAFHTTARAGICEEFSRHPEFMRGMQEMGMSVENCELWLSRVSLAFAAFLFTLIVIRLHFLLAISTYYKGLSRCCRTCCSSHHRDGSTSHSRTRSWSRSDNTKRIYLLPPSSEDAAALEDGIELVYAPVPVNKLSQDRWSQAKEAWVSDTVPSSATDQRVQRKHHHARRHSQSNSVLSNTRTGPLFLPIQSGEGLLDRDYTKV